MVDLTYLAGWRLSSGLLFVYMELRYYTDDNLVVDKRIRCSFNLLYCMKKPPIPQGFDCTWSGTTIGV
jgi:hypothetical protein